MLNCECHICLEDVNTNHFARHVAACSRKHTQSGRPNARASKERASDLIEAVMNKTQEAPAKGETSKEERL